MEYSKFLRRYTQLDLALKSCFRRVQKSLDHTKETEPVVEIVATSRFSRAVVDKFICPIKALTKWASRNLSNIPQADTAHFPRTCRAIKREGRLFSKTKHHIERSE